MKDVLVSFKYNTHNGGVHGIYILTSAEWKKIRFLQKNNENIIMFDILGRHSEITVSADNFVLVSKDERDIESFRVLFGRTFGSYEPIDSAMLLYEDLIHEEEEDE